MCIFKEIKDIWNYRQMIYSLVRKDLRGRYKGSVLGFLWTFINPLFQLIIYTIVFSTILQSNIDKFYLFLFVALVPWIFFSAALTGGASSIINEKNLVQKIFFPRAVIPISYVTSCFVNMLLTFIIIFIVVVISGIKLHLFGLLCLPIIMVIEYLLALGIALLSSAITVYFRDLEHILGIVSMAWLYLTPILYSVDIVPKQYKTLFYMNPLTPIIMAYRDVLYYGSVPQVRTLISASLWGVIVLILGSYVFNRLQRGFAEEL